MNHKRGRPKHQRAGCLMCKPWKDERGHTYGEASEKPTVRRRLQDDPVQEAADYEPDPCANGTCDHCFGGE